jgi:hypothetical protein
MVYDPFEDNDDDGEGDLGDIDPEKNFLSEIRGEIIKNCKYYYSINLHDEILPKMSNSDLSLFHLNIRSLPKFFDTLIPTLHASGIHFNLISLSETWLKPSNADCYGIQGYAHEYLTRREKPGGGVSIFINENWNYIKSGQI